MESVTGEDRWLTKRGYFVTAEGTEWMAGDVAALRAKVQADPAQYRGYMTRAGVSNGGWLWKVGYDVGQSPDFTAVLYRTMRLRSTRLFTDSWTSSTGETCARPGRGEGLADGVAGLCLFREVSPAALLQGFLGDCWLISAIASVAEFPELIKKRFKQAKLSSEGKYEVMLFHPIEDRWVTMTIDDRLPVNGMAFKYLRMSKEGELWPCLLEKAFAMLQGGGWRKLQGSTMAKGAPLICGQLAAFKALTGITGAGSYMLMQRTPQHTWTLSSPNWQNGDFSVAEWPDCEGGQERSNASVFGLLRRLNSRNSIMCCTARESKSAKDRVAPREIAPGRGGAHISEGVVQDHGYSLTDARSVGSRGETFDLLELRNSWGDTEYTGPWSDDHEMWKRHPGVLGAIKPTFGDDGKFWIDRESFVRKFGKIYVLNQDSRAARALSVPGPDGMGVSEDRCSDRCTNCTLQ